MAAKYFTLDLVIVPTAGTAVPISATAIPVSTVLIQADSLNTGAIYVKSEGASNVAAQELYPGQNIVIDAPLIGGTPSDILLSDVWLDTATNGNAARVSCLRRRV